MSETEKRSGILDDAKLDAVSGGAVIDGVTVATHEVLWGCNDCHRSWEAPFVPKQTECPYCHLHNVAMTGSR